MGLGVQKGLKPLCHPALHTGQGCIQTSGLCATGHGHVGLAAALAANLLRHKIHQFASFDAAHGVGADAKALRETLDKLKDKLKTAVVVLASVDGDKVQIAAGVTAETMGKVKAGELVNFVAQQVGGKGGGKADMAMAGGTEPAKIDAALASVQAWVTERV